MDAYILIGLLNNRLRTLKLADRKIAYKVIDTYNEFEPLSEEQMEWLTKICGQEK